MHVEKHSTAQCKACKMLFLAVTICTMCKASELQTVPCYELWKLTAGELHL
jgi:hypothetical protein